MRNTIFLLPVLVFGVLVSNAQNKVTDSIHNKIKTHQNRDTTCVKLINQLAYQYYRSGNYDELFNYAGQAQKLADSLNYIQGGAKARRYIGLFYKKKSNYNEALKFYKLAIEEYQKVGDETSVSALYKNIGNVYLSKGNYPKALEYYHKNLTICKKNNNQKAAAGIYNNIGVIYKRQENYSKALDYFERSLNIRKKAGLDYSVAGSYNNIGIIHKNLGNYSEALRYYNNSLKIRKTLKDNSGISVSYNNIGTVYEEQEKYDEALEKYRQSLSLKLKLGNKSGLVSVYNGLSSVYFKIKNYKEAYSHSQKAYQTAREISNVYLIKESAELYAQSCYAMGLYKDAYESHQVFTSMKDSLFSEEVIKKITGLEYKHVYEQEKQAMEFEQEKKDAIRNAKAKKEKVVRNFLIAGIAFAVVLAIVFFRGLILKRKANTMLGFQKKQIEEANEELGQINEELNSTLDIVSSQKDEIEAQRDEATKQRQEIISGINYAELIQKAVLPSEELMQEILPEHFLVFKPRDIVSGDFYWLKQIRNYTIVAVADCTGHGVPGAFMSMLGSSFLNEIVTARSLDQSGQILDKLREKVKQSLKQKGLDGEQKDGMDISLYVIDTETNELQFSGAFNSLYIASKSTVDPKTVPAKTAEPELIELKADRQPIAIYTDEKKFTTHRVQLMPGDCLYTFSDGFADQFGGKRNKKYKLYKFKQLLTAVSQKPMSEQKNILESEFEQWKGNLEQLDDVIVLGIRIA
ncbi:MAG: tetratricopeptide repeat protein [Bacteroidota bacterium]|nr:tetratricopeptide repeat protein [Bacteroidota bacterium]